MGANTTKPEQGEDDLSMEEILQSIRKIIAEDEDEGKQGNMNDDAKQSTESSVPGSDVLELTEMITDDGSVVSLKTEAPAEPAPAPAADILSQIDEVLAPPAAPEPKAQAPAAEPAPAKPVEIVVETVESIPEPPPPSAPAPAAEDDSLLSAQAAATSIAALKRLKTAEPEKPAAPASPAPAFRDGTTVEDLVTEMLRPMMKAWLDANLPAIVERIVEREVRKLTQ